MEHNKPKRDKYALTAYWPVLRPVTLRLPHSARPASRNGRARWLCVRKWRALTSSRA